MMITSIILKMTGFFGPPETLSAEITADTVTARLTNGTTHAEKTVAQTLRGADAQAWQQRLATIAIDQWQDDYPQDPAGLIMDGTQWTLAVTWADGRTRQMSGDNVFPAGWDDLTDLLQQAALAPNGHILPPQHWQFDFVRFADLNLPHFHGDTEQIRHSKIYQQTILIHPARHTLQLRTAFPDSRPSHTTTYTDAHLVDALVPAVSDAVQGLGQLATTKLDTTDYPSAAFGIVLTYQDDDQIVVQTDADDTEMLAFWRDLERLVDRAITLAHHEDDREWHQFGPFPEYYVQVAFNDGGKAYTYKTDIPDLAINDQVTVPVGANDHQLIGTIVAISDTLPPNLTIPADAIKSISGKNE